MGLDKEEYENDPQHLAFQEAHKNPTTDHQLLELFDSGEFIYKPKAKVKGPEAFEGWDEGREK